MCHNVDFYWMNKKVLTGSSFDELHKVNDEKSEKKKLSILESFQYLSNSNI